METWVFAWSRPGRQIQEKVKSVAGLHRTGRRLGDDARARARGSLQHTCHILKRTRQRSSSEPTAGRPTHGPAMSALGHRRRSRRIAGWPRYSSARFAWHGPLFDPEVIAKLKYFITVHCF